MYKNLREIISFIIIFVLLALCCPSYTHAVDSNGVWLSLPNMNVSRDIHGSVLLKNGQVLIASGFNNNFLNSSELYNPINKTWSFTGNINTPRLLWVDPGMVTLNNGKVLVAAGEGPNVTDIGTSELYDPTTGNWTYTGDVNTPRRRAILALLPDNKVILAGGGHGGSGSDRFLASSEIYDPNSGIWSYTGNLNIGRETDERYVTLSDGRIMIAGGQSARTWPSQVENTAEIYNLTTGKWTLTSQMPYGWAGATMTLLQDGRVFVTGGNDGTENVASTALYNPTTDTWTSTANMNIARADHRAILLSDGKVMVFGGIKFGISLASATNGSTEIYDPKTNLWTLGPSLPNAISPWNVTKLANGDYLVTGGSDENGNFLSKAYLFTSSNNALNVPFFKQTSNPWQSQEYDSAKSWVQPKEPPTINRWGCALTSAVMILEYYNIHSLPDGQDLDPGTLNTWLKNQPDGYVNEGWVNWLAISRLSKLAANINHITSFDALEYQNYKGANKTQLTNDLNNSIPDILEEPGHFVVGTGIDGNTFDINDPYYTRKTLNDGYNNTFLSLGRYTPAHTDLSYIMLTANPDVTLTVTDSNGKQVGESLIQNPIQDPLDPTQTNSALTIYYLPKPDNGNYTITASSIKSPYEFKSYLYDSQGNSNIQTLNGFTNGKYVVAFNKSDNSQSTTNKQVTFDNVIQDIKSAEKLHLINDAFANALIVILQGAKSQATSHKQIAIQMVNSAIVLLEKSNNHPELISQTAYGPFHDDLTSLKSSL